MFLHVLLHSNMRGGILSCGLHLLGDGGSILNDNRDGGDGVDGNDSDDGDGVDGRNSGNHDRHYGSRPV